MTRLLLVGAGHAHAQVLRDWAAAPRPGVQLALVGPHALAPYSGMVPGWLAGAYRFEQIVIDFAALARAAGAAFVAGEAVALDAARRTLTLADGRALGYDVLSLNIGSTLHVPALDGCTVLPMRPLDRLRQRYGAVLDALAREPARGLAVTAVGGGAAGCETLLAVLARLRAAAPRLHLDARLVARGDALLPGLARGAARRMQAALTRAGVEVHAGRDFDATQDAPPGSLVLWATGAQAHGWPARSGLACDDAGFVRIDALLRSPSHPEVHAAGDCAAWAEPLPKAGVFAVRMGPVLSRNLRAALGDGDALAYRPQRRHLALLATADGRAIASWGRASAEGAWVWRCKDRIDRGFVARHAPR
ncbi:MAG: FAD-dependent oxidoreductase [Gammaproteobacteria bacterium]|uniref:FAD-dependent oxidoreductase n=1 Tax=Azohydromonas sp. TaxID=1872666 RepID=UPI002CB0266B|nr:FAD-dependent oxidoreductase [Azohydromonas sp.]HMM84030.1 FAD-dependent oxidoreductase [Azohydromonas sp.]